MSRLIPTSKLLYCIILSLTKKNPEPQNQRKEEKEKKKETEEKHKVACKYEFYKEKNARGRALHLTRRIAHDIPLYTASLFTGQEYQTCIGNTAEKRVFVGFYIYKERTRLKRAAGR